MTDREAQRAAVHGVAESRTRLSDWTEPNIPSARCPHHWCGAQWILTNWTTHVTSTQFQKQNLLAPRAFLCSVLSLPCHKEDITHTRTPEVSFVCFCISWKQRIVQFILFDSVFFHSTLCLWGSSVLLHVIRSFVLTAMRYSIVWLYPNLCIHLIFVGHLGRFLFGLLNWSCYKHCCLNNQWKGSPIIKVHKRKSQDQ